MTLDRPGRLAVAADRRRARPTGRGRSSPSACRSTRSGTVAARPSPSPRSTATPGPTTTAAPSTVQVADDKARVLLVDGEARWEFRYLRNALARDPRVTVEAVVFHQPEPRP